MSRDGRVVGGESMILRICRTWSRAAIGLAAGVAAIQLALSAGVMAQPEEAPRPGVDY